MFLVQLPFCVSAVIPTPPPFKHSQVFPKAFIFPLPPSPPPPSNPSQPFVRDSPSSTPPLTIFPFIRSRERETRASVPWGCRKRSPFFIWRNRKVDQVSSASLRSLFLLFFLTVHSFPSAAPWPLLSLSLSLAGWGALAERRLELTEYLLPGGFLTWIATISVYVLAGTEHFLWGSAGANLSPGHGERHQEKSAGTERMLDWAQRRGRDLRIASDTNANKSKWDRYFFKESNLTKCTELGGFWTGKGNCKKAFWNTFTHNLSCSSYRISFPDALTEERASATYALVDGTTHSTPITFHTVRNAFRWEDCGLLPRRSCVLKGARGGGRPPGHMVELTQDSCRLSVG